MPTRGREVGAPEVLQGGAADLARSQALEAEAPDVRGDGFEGATDNEESTNGSGAMNQMILPGAAAPGVPTPAAPPNAPPLEDCPSGSGWPRLCLESLLKRKRSPCHSDGTRRPLKPRRYVAADE